MIVKTYAPPRLTSLFDYYLKGKYQKRSSGPARKLRMEYKISWGAIIKTTIISSLRWAGHIKRIDINKLI